MQQLSIVIACFLVFAAAATDALKEYAEIRSNYLESEVDGWEPPKDLRTNFTYYWSGCDEDRRPLWISEMGKWDVRGFIEQGPEAEMLLDKYIDQLALHVLQSLNFTKTDPVPQIVAILDIDGFNYYQLASSQTLNFILKKFTFFSPGIIKYVKSAYIINTNFVATTLIKLIKPVFGDAFERFEILGTNKNKWMPRLIQELPRSELPEWYGGTKEFAPIKVYG